MPNAITPNLPARLAKIALLLLPGIAISIQAQPQHHALRSPVEVASPAGKQTFASRCSSCHGLDGRGGERAPNIATNPRVQHLSDAELERVVSNGKPDSGMPAFRLIGKNELQAIVEYLRVLQGQRAPMALVGDPQKGKTIFFGKAACSSCHMVAGHGGFIASDLSAYAQTLSPDEIRKAITDPTPPLRARSAIATTRDGQKISGMVRNQDNFSVQMQSDDGAFHFFLKSDLESLEYQPQSLMPSDYGQKLSRQELDDVVSYMQSLKANAKSELGEEE